MINILLQLPVAMDCFLDNTTKHGEYIDLSYLQNRMDFAEAEANLTLWGKKIESASWLRSVKNKPSTMTQVLRCAGCFACRNEKPPLKSKSNTNLSSLVPALSLVYL